MRFIHYITKNLNNIVHVFYRRDFQSRFLKIYRCACVDNALKALRYYSMAMHASDIALCIQMINEKWGLTIPVLNNRIRKITQK